MPKAGAKAAGYNAGSFGKKQVLIPLSVQSALIGESPMSSHHHDDTTPPPNDAVEAILPLMPVVLPVVGALMMFLLAFIAVHMA